MFVQFLKMLLKRARTKTKYEILIALTVFGLAWGFTIAAGARAFAQAPDPPLARVISTGPCEPQQAYQDPSTLGPLGPNDNPSLSDAVFCVETNTIKGRVWSTWVGTGEGNNQKLEGAWRLEDQFGNPISQPDYEVVNNPEEGIPAEDHFEFQIPLNGKQYNLCVNRAVKQLPENTGGLPATDCRSFVSGLGETRLIKTDQHGNPIPDQRAALQQFKNNQWGLMLEATTDMMGVIRVTDLDEGSYVWVEDQSDMLFGAHPISPPAGVYSFTLSAISIRQVVTFTNFVPELLYMAPVAKSGPSTVQDCNFYQLHLYSQDTDEWYCFDQNNSFAELRFSLGEVVYAEWTTAGGIPLNEFPGESGLFYLDNAPIGYQDFTSPGIQLQATKWYPEGNPPWLGQHNELTAEFMLEGDVYRVTVPMIWDP